MTESSEKYMFSSFPNLHDQDLVDLNNAQFNSIEIHPMWDVCLTPGPTSFTLEFAEIPEMDVFFQLLRLEHQIYKDTQPEGEVEERQIQRRKNYYFVFPGVYCIDNVVSDLSRYFQSRGMKVRVRSNFPAIAAMEEEAMVPSMPSMFLVKEPGEGE